MNNKFFTTLMLPVLICLCSLSLSCKKNSQEPDDACFNEPVYSWKKIALESDGFDIYANYSFAADNIGNVYLATKIKGTVDADPGDGLLNMQGPGVLIQKLNMDGKLIWAKVVVPPVIGLSMTGMTLAVDAQRNVYLSTQFSGLDRLVKFNEAGQDISDFPSYYFGAFLSVDKDENVYQFDGSTLLKYKGSQLFIEKNTVFCNSGANIIQVTASPNNNIYILGEVYGEDADFDPYKGVALEITDHITDNKRSIYYVQKLDVKGNLLWVKQVGLGGFYDTPKGMLVDHNDNVYINKYDNDDWRYNTLLKLANDGSLRWQKKIIKNESIAFDGDNNIYAAGYLQWERYDANGELTWSHFNDIAYTGRSIATGDGYNMYSLIVDVDQPFFRKAILTLRRFTFCGR